MPPLLLTTAVADKAEPASLKLCRLKQVPAAKAAES
jgi:hypothetical protein